MYADDFAARMDMDDPDRSKIHVPIDVRAVAKKLETDPELLFGRLYYHLDHKYGYTQDDGAKVHLFTLKAGKDLYCVQYPYLAAVLSERNVEHRRNLLAIGLAIFSLIIAGASLVAQLSSTSDAPNPSKKAQPAAAGTAQSAAPF